MSEEKTAAAEAEQDTTRTWLYRNGESRIFEGAKAIAAAQDDGWQESPTAAEPAADEPAAKPSKGKKG